MFENCVLDVCRVCENCVLDVCRMCGKCVEAEYLHKINSVVENSSRNRELTSSCVTSTKHTIYHKSGDYEFYFTGALRQ